MKMKTIAILGLSALALAACGGKKHHHHDAPAPASSERFVCENGDKVTITQLGDSIELALKYDVTPPKTVRLYQQPSASGAFYTSSTGFFGYGAEWHQKGGQANLTYYSDEGSVVLSCDAQ